MKKFLKSASILLVIPKPSARTGLKKMLADLGATSQLVDAAVDFEQAKTKLEANPVNLVFMDDDFENQKIIFDLMILQQKKLPDPAKRFFVLMAGQVNPEFQAEFMAHRGDLIIAKPYTIGSFTEAFTKSLEERDAKIKKEQAEVILKQRQKDKAIKVFGPLKNLQQDIMRVTSLDQEFAGACDNFFKKLENQFDASSMVNLVSTGIKTKKYSELDQFVEGWIKSFPLYAESVPDITRVLVYNQKFHLLNEMLIDDKAARVAMGAGMVVASSFYLDQGDKVLSVEFAKKGIEFADYKKSVLLKALEIIVSAGEVGLAKKIFESPKVQKAISDDPALTEELKKMIA